MHELSVYCLDAMTTYRTSRLSDLLTQASLMVKHPPSIYYGHMHELPCNFMGH